MVVADTNYKFLYVNACAEGGLMMLILVHDASSTQLSMNALASQTHHWEANAFKTMKTATK